MESFTFTVDEDIAAGELLTVRLGGRACRSRVEYHADAASNEERPVRGIGEGSIMDIDAMIQMRHSGAGAPDQSTLAPGGFLEVARRRGARTAVYTTAELLANQIAAVVVPHTGHTRIRARAASAASEELVLFLERLAGDLHAEDLQRSRIDHANAAGADEAAAIIKALREQLFEARGELRHATAIIQAEAAASAARSSLLVGEIETISGE